MKVPTSAESNSPKSGDANEKPGDKAIKSSEKGVLEAEKAPSVEEKMAELTELLQRTRAEFENYKKRVEKEKQAVWAFGQAETLRQLLPVLDSFDQALEKGSEAEKKALEPIAKQAREILAKMGVHPLHVKGKKFDAGLHDCLLVESNPKQPDGIVLEELHKGYLLNGNVLRHAKVKVNRIEAKPEAGPANIGKKNESSGNKTNQ